MTTQEFVKQEVNKISKESTLHGSKLFADGLTKGLEISCEFTDWVTMHLRRSFPNGVEEPVYFRNGINPLFEPKRPYTTSELLTIFLTEKYGNNG